MFSSMTPEDFFTLTEMKSGLTTLARVEELICVMQAQKSRATSNAGDAARQWLTVASTLASTEDRDCLSHFVCLNGLCFLNQWLQEAVKYNQVAADAEEFINVLLGSLERLPTDRKKLSASGVLLTVEKLFSHKAAGIRVRAHALFERWNAERINDNGCRDLEKDCLNLVETSEPSSDATLVEDKHDYDQDFDCPRQTVTEEGSRNEKIQTSPNNIQSNTTGDGLKGSMPHQTMKVISLSEEKEKSALSPTQTLDSSSFEEKLSVGESSISPVGMASSIVPVFRVEDDDACITSATKNHEDIDAEVNALIGVSYDSGQRDGFCVLSSSGPAASSPAQKSMLVRSISAILVSRNGKFNMSEPMDTSPRSVSADQGMSKHSRKLAEFKTKEESPLDNGSLHRKEAAEFDSEDNLLLNEPILKECEEADEMLFSDPSRLSKCKVTKELIKKSDLDLESGEFDALEVARQVAIEVEREVVDYREQSCSSSTDVSSREIVSTAIPDITENNQDHPISGKPNGNGPASDKDDSDTASSPKNDNCQFSKVTTNLRKMKQSLQSTNQAAADDQKTSNMTRKIKCDFDLNVNVFSENFDCAMNPISSNPVPITPLHFEGELGWRGSAATSAFCPAFLQMGQDSGKTNSVSKPKENLIEIDLNVAESESDLAVDPAVFKELPVSYCIPSGDSSVEVSSGKAVRIHLDLNSIGDEEAPSFQSSLLSYHPQKRSRSLSPTSSSSSSRKLSMRNFDLNDNLFVLDGCGSQNINMSNSSAFTITGSKMSVERTDDTNHAHQTMESGLRWEAFTEGRPLMPYAHQVPPPGYGYNGLGIAPTFPFQPALYGDPNIPLMAISRSATVMPQLMGSSGPHSAHFSSHPFLMSTPSSSNGAESSNPGLDLNSGILQLESGNREARSQNHFFMPGHSNPLEEQMKTASQHSTSGLPLKRKEPDSGWDPYSFGYNQATSWH